MLGVLVWHVLSYRFAIVGLQSELGASVVPTRAELEAASATDFLQIVARLGASADHAAQLEVRRAQLVAASTWVQRLFTNAPSSAWKSQNDAKLKELFAALPRSFGTQSRQLTNRLLSVASSGSPGIRDSAVSYKALRAAMLSTAEGVDAVAKRLSLHVGSTAAAVRNDPVASQTEQWIDLSARAEQEALRTAQVAMSLATQASQNASGLRQDAPSGEIGAVVSMWARAADTAHASIAALGDQRPPARLAALYTGLTASARDKAQSVASEIDTNLSTAQAAYQTALSEESTVTGRLMRFGRRTVASVKRFASSTADELQRRTNELTQAASANFEQAVTTSTQAIAQGISAYQESRKPALQRFLENPTGLAITIGAIVLVLILSVALKRGGSSTV